jgi:hypothetical protein
MHRSGSWSKLGLNAAFKNPYWCVVRKQIYVFSCNRACSPRTCARSREPSPSPSSRHAFDCCTRAFSLHALHPRMLDTQVQLEERLETLSTSPHDKTQDQDKDRLIKELRCGCVSSFVFAHVVVHVCTLFIPLCDTLVPDHSSVFSGQLYLTLIVLLSMRVSPGFMV